MNSRIRDLVAALAAIGVALVIALGGASQAAAWEGCGHRSRTSDAGPCVIFRPVPTRTVIERKPRPALTTPAPEVGTPRTPEVGTPPPTDTE